jgi:hypothetical protein
MHLKTMSLRETESSPRAIFFGESLISSSRRRPFGKSKKKIFSAKKKTLGEEFLRREQKKTLGEEFFT